MLVELTYSIIASQKRQSTQLLPRGFSGRIPSSVGRATPSHHQRKLIKNRLQGLDIKSFPNKGSSMPWRVWHSDSLRVESCVIPHCQFQKLGCNSQGNLHILIFAHSIEVRVMSGVCGQSRGAYEAGQSKSRIYLLLVKNCVLHCTMDRPSCRFPSGLSFCWSFQQDVLHANPLYFQTPPRLDHPITAIMPVPCWSSVMATTGRFIKVHKLTFTGFYRGRSPDVSWFSWFVSSSLLRSKS